MTLDEVEAAFKAILNDWEHSTTRGQVRLEIESLETLLGEIETMPSTPLTHILWDQINDLQGIMRLELCGKVRHTPRVFSRA
jgi:hypothetical protein